jgi:hypothetical protein
MTKRQNSLLNKKGQVITLIFILSAILIDVRVSRRVQANREKLEKMQF